VVQQPCLVCGREPSDPHHLRFARPRGLGQKISDELTVPLCPAHHRELHRAGKEAAWWTQRGIEPLATARRNDQANPSFSKSIPPAATRKLHRQLPLMCYYDGDAGQPQCCGH
jgi:hypothetical protein